MSKEKEMLKTILANTKAIMDHLKINGTMSQDKPSGTPVKDPAKKDHRPKKAKTGSTKCYSQA